MRAHTILVLAAVCPPAIGQMRFTDATESVGLDGINAVHVVLADLTGDGRPDAIIRAKEDDGEHYRVFVNTPVERAEGEKGLGFVFEPLTGETGLPVPDRGDLCAFADLDNDGTLDAIFTRYLDINNEKYEPPKQGPRRSCWLRGNGDGTFGQPVGTWHEIEQAEPRTTAAIAVGDVDRDGRLDLYLGNWYVKYGGGYEGFSNDLLIQTPNDAGQVAFERRALPEDDAEFDEEHDLAGRPTYGVMVCSLIADAGPQLLELDYGRRWNRLWTREGDWRDIAARLGLAGDAIRHGRYPKWLNELLVKRGDEPRENEPPFRSNGNTFDAAIGDIDNDGDFDLFLAEITHGWAGTSSDRSRFLFQVHDKAGTASFVSSREHAVDRVPPDPTIRSWNQGDLYAALADFDNDGRLDLLLASSDYPDNQRLRIYRQQTDGTFADLTSWIGIDHDGAQHPSLGDIDGDGDIDILVGQSFFRYDKAKKAGRTPRVRCFLSQAIERDLGHAITLTLVGDPARGVSRDAIGAIVRVTADIDGQIVTQSRQLIGPGGHQAKQHELLVHVGLGDATTAQRVEILWPCKDGLLTTLTDLPAGHHVIRLAEQD